LKYDPSLIVDSSFTAATFSNVPLQQGDDVLFVGLSRKFQPLWQTTAISRIEELFIPEGRPPRFRAVNEEVIHLEKPPSCVGGVLVDSNGHIQALWASYSSSDRKDPTTAVEFFSWIFCGTSGGYFATSKEERKTTLSKSGSRTLAYFTISKS